MSSFLTIKQIHQLAFNEAKKLIHHSYAISIIALLLAFVSVSFTAHNQNLDAKGLVYEKVSGHSPAKLLSSTHTSKYFQVDNNIELAKTNTKATTHEAADEYYQVNRTFINKFGEGYLEYK